MVMTVLLLLELSVQTASMYHLGLSADVTGKQAQNAQHAGIYLHPVTEGMLCVFHFFIRYVTLHVYITLRRQFMQHIQ